MRLTGAGTVLGVAWSPAAANGLAVAAVLTVLAGCAPAQYAAQADRDVYGTIRQARQVALGSDRPFDVAYRPLTGAKDRPEGPIRIGDKVIPVGSGEPVTLTLDDCLQIAFRNSRSFQTRTEALYTAALALANSRRGWDVPLPGGSLDGSVSRSVVNRGGETNYASFRPDLTLTQKLIHGGQLGVGLGVELVSDLLGWRSTTVGSLLSANFTQPLLRGAWRGLAYEEQYRAERDFLLAVLEYERFTQEFAVDILTRYYAVLQQRDQLANEQTNIRRLTQTHALTRTLVEGGFRSRIEEDQAQQNLLEAEVRAERSQQLYRDVLDQFKLALGVPMAAMIELDYPGALEELKKVGPKPIPVPEAEAFDVALAARPDVLAQGAALRDARRDVELAADAFLPQLDVTLGVSAASAGPRDAARVQFHRHTRSAGATFNYEIDQTDHRDAYRRRLIALEEAKRRYDEFIDQLRLDIRRSYRSLLQSRRSYEIQVRNVEIANRRTKLAVLEQKGGAASARDVLEAEDAFRRAQNGLTEALVNYATTRLRFMATLGLIAVDEKGLVHELDKPVRFDRVGKRYPYLARP